MYTYLYYMLSLRQENDFNEHITENIIYTLYF